MSNPSTPSAVDNPNDREVHTPDKMQAGTKELGCEDASETGVVRMRAADEPLGLCKKCEGIDFNVLLDPDIIAGVNTMAVVHMAAGIYYSQHVTILLRLGQPSNWSNSTCRVCQFWYACFESVLGTSPRGVHDNEEFIFGSTVAETASSRAEIEDRSFFFVSGALRTELELSLYWDLLYWDLACFISVSTLHDIQVRRIGSFINPCIPQAWLDYCSTTHQSCKTNDTALHVKGMRLIDCRTGTIVEARASHKYLALSYVWGASQITNQGSSHLGPLPDDLPQTVQDAIDFTLLLDRTDYLWVDRLCIDENAEIKHNQIASMDRVYQNAMLTLIAASGDNASHGISGVSRARLQQQLDIWLGSHHLISTLPGSRIVEHSVWATRGWTYQEALLSQRRLFFTDQQMYYECGELCCKETLNVSHSLFDRSPDYLYERGVDYPIYALTSGEVSMPRIVNAYTDRIITYDFDALNACLGILHAFTKKNPPQYHFHGMPISDSHGDYSAGEFATTLLWVNRASSRPSRRRQSFPSWCWTGWDLAVHIPTRGFGLPRCQEDAGAAVSIELTNGKILDWEHALSVIKANNSHLFSSFLHLDCQAYETTFQCDGSSFYDSMCYSDEMEGFNGRLRLTWDMNAEGLKDRLCTGSWTCVLLYMRREYIRYHFLVVGWKGNTAYRIGLLNRDIKFFDESKLERRRIRLG